MDAAGRRYRSIAARPATGGQQQHGAAAANAGITGVEARDHISMFWANSGEFAINEGVIAGVEARDHISTPSHPTSATPALALRRPSFPPKSTADQRATQTDDAR